MLLVDPIHHTKGVDKLSVGFKVAYPVEVGVAHLVGGFGFRVACLVDAWSGL